MAAALNIDSRPRATTSLRERALIGRVRALLVIFIIALILSGLTAFPLETELQWIVDMLGRSHATGLSPHSPVLRWLTTVRDALVDTNTRYPFLSYGTDWLAFAHLVIAIAFIGPLRDPVRNRWVVTFGLIACTAVVPFALVAGSLRGIPLFWRLIDCAFGVGGVALLWPCLRAIDELELLSAKGVAKLTS
jgi:hypothetical protein